MHDQPADAGFMAIESSARCRGETNLAVPWLQVRPRLKLRAAAKGTLVPFSRRRRAPSF